MKSSVVFAVCLMAVGFLVYYLNLPPAPPPSATDDPHDGTTATGGIAHPDAIQYRAKDSRAAIVEPEFVNADEAKIAGGTKGIGVSIDGDSRFYPLYVLQYHQIVNDTCGNRAIACSY
jgi:hypothetical protein